MSTRSGLLTFMCLLLLTACTPQDEAELRAAAEQARQTAVARRQRAILDDPQTIAIRRTDEELRGMLHDEVGYRRLRRFHGLSNLQAQQESDGSPVSLLHANRRVRGPLFSLLACSGVARRLQRRSRSSPSAPRLSALTRSDGLCRRKEAGPTRSPCPARTRTFDHPKESV